MLKPNSSGIKTNPNRVYKKEADPLGSAFSFVHYYDYFSTETQRHGEWLTDPLCLCVFVVNLFIIKQNIYLALFLDALHQFTLHLPASHLAEFHLATQFIGGDSRIVAYHVHDFECLGKIDAATMENGMGRR
jgi:hypothetical protein